MITSQAVSYIQDELKYEAKRYFYDKYSALDSEIDGSGFVYTSGTTTVVHQFKAISQDYIIKTINDEMTSVAMVTTPTKLLEKTGSSPSVLRVIDKHWYIRVPAYPLINGSMDIDDGLAQVVIFRALATLGVGKFIQTSKEMLDQYAKNITIPDPFEATVDIGFRFTIDESSWHDTYVDGDLFFAISKDGVWGNSIPIGSTGAPTGATNFVELGDVQTPLISNKMLAVNSAGDAIVLVDAPTSTGGSSDITRKDFVSVTGTQTLDLSGDFRLFNINITGNATINILKNAQLDYDLVPNQKYIFVISPNTFTVAFHGDVFINGLTAINPASGIVILEVLYYDLQLYVVSQKEI